MNSTPEESGSSPLTPHPTQQAARRDAGAGGAGNATSRARAQRARPGPVSEATSEGERGPAFVPVEIEGPVGSPAGLIIADPPSPIPRVPAPMIEIVMPAVTVRVPTGVDAATLATVLATLRALA